MHRLSLPLASRSRLPLRSPARPLRSKLLRVSYSLLCIRPRDAGLQLGRPIRQLPCRFCRLREGHDRTHFDRPKSRAGDFLGNRGRRVDTLRFNQVVATQLFLSLRKRAIGGQPLAVAYAYGFRGLRRLQRMTTLDVAGELLAKRAVLVQFAIVIAAGETLFVFVDQQQVLHFSFLLTRTTGTPAKIDSGQKEFFVSGLPLQTKGIGTFPRFVFPTALYYPPHDCARPYPH